MVRGAAQVAGRARLFARSQAVVHPAMVNGAVLTVGGRVALVMGFTVREGRVVAIDVPADVDRLGRLPMPRFENQ
ncbi:hypothetical protein Pth03_80150 [Planotetraspora thailandica]|uniref:Uncharacterized protein n=1 Tax=Planotetraspora thailandica TaxID=487172 RepID=A0A8J4DFR1_9ACTN|nr:hypothetical protein Pth03_80150 [Planotetraspora thailandica]